MGRGWEPPGQTATMLLRATDLVVRHHPSLPPVLAGVSLEVGSGELVAVVGSNGSGKSTLARALAGLVEVESGSVTGGEGGGAPRVGLVLQDPAAQLVAATVADELALGPEGAGHPPTQVAAVVDALVRAHRLDALWARDPGTLSGGQQQRVAVAAIEACDVDVLVLDEPTALLDAGARERFGATVRGDAGQRGVVWITQVADDVARCDRVVVLDAGVVVWHGAVGDYLEAPQVAATYGLELPASARVAHALRARGAWPSGATIPRELAGLVPVLAGAGPARA
ncbi:MAG: cobalt transporter ATP-binding protein [Thermoleophilia bacterium]|nr:cobalt transporter ATP-binding protein [Thermoleophilia bacterium]